MKTQKWEIDPQREFADELYRLIKMQIENNWCYDLAAILIKDKQADLVFSFELLKNKKLKFSIKIY